MEPHLKRPLWEIDKITAVKGFGVTKPHQGSFITQPTYVTSQNFVAETTTVVEVDPVPSVEVKAWTEITHAGLNDWVISEVNATAWAKPEQLTTY